MKRSRGLGYTAEQIESGAVMSARELLEKHENHLMLIKKRLYFLKAFEGELKVAARGKVFEIRNNAVYSSLYDTWHQLVIDLCSLCVDMYGRGGFFNCLNNHLSELRPAKKKDITPPGGVISYPDAEPTEVQQDQDRRELDEHFTAVMLESSAAAFYRLFPLAKERADKKITQQDVGHLKDVFKSIVEAIVLDRNRNRAHRYERSQTSDSAVALTTAHLEEKFKAIEQILNDVRHICGLGTLAYTDMNECNVHETAKDLVDLILLGSSKQIHQQMGMNDDLKKGGGSFGWTYRDTFYKKVHEQHELKYSEICQKEAEKCCKAASYDGVKVPPVYFNALHRYK